MKQRGYECQHSSNTLQYQYQHAHRLLDNKDNKNNKNMNVNSPNHRYNFNNQINTLDLEMQLNYPQKQLQTEERHEKEAANYLKQISEDHWLYQNKNQTHQKFHSYHKMDSIEQKNNHNTISFKPRKKTRNYLDFNKTCTLRQRPTTMQKNTFFQHTQKQKDKSQRYRQRDAQTSMYFYESLNLKDTVQNIEEEVMFLNDFKKQQQKSQNLHGLVNMKHNLKYKSQYYQKLKYHLFKTFQIDGKPLLQNAYYKNKNKKKQSNQDPQFITQSPCGDQYFHLKQKNSVERRSVYSSKKKISLDISTLDTPPYLNSKQNNLTAIHSQYNRSKQLKLMQQEEYNYLLSKKQKKKTFSNFNNNDKNTRNSKASEIQININELDMNINVDIGLQSNSKNRSKIIRSNKSKRVDQSIISKWDKNSMRGKLWLGRPPIKIIQKMSDSQHL